MKKLTSLIFAISLCVAFAQFTPSGLLNYFRSIQGKGIISGQFIGLGPLDPIIDIHTHTGKWLGLIGGDYWSHGSKNFQAEYSQFNSIAKDYWMNGGLITLSLEMANPTTGGSASDLSNLSARDILLPGTTTNTNFMTMINSIGDGLADLQSSGVTVIFRPFHESNGNWFWWGTTLMSPKQFQEMWQFVHKYFTQNRGLKNLVWVYGGNTYLSNYPIINYPGDSYIDMMGLDVYSSLPMEFADEFTALKKNYSKILCLAEFGPGNSSSGDLSFQEPLLIQQAQKYLSEAVYFLQWWDINSVGIPGWGMAETQNVKEALNNPYTINRDQIFSDFPLLLLVRAVAQVQ